jgi:hypothetical protein
MINPRSDGALRALAKSLLDGAQSPADLESGLREAYPRVMVRERALSHEAVTVWYVYREGSWIASETS